MGGSCTKPPFCILSFKLSGNINTANRANVSELMVLRERGLPGSLHLHAYTGVRFVLGSKVRACFLLKIAPQMGEGEKRDGSANIKTENTEPLTQGLPWALYIPTSTVGKTETPKLPITCCRKHMMNAALYMLKVSCIQSMLLGKDGVTSTEREPAITELVCIWNCKC